MEARRVFRLYSRKVFLAPNNRHFHEQRINAALLLTEKEPLQGAVADFFYGCWYDIPYDVNNLFTRIKDRLYLMSSKGFAIVLVRSDIFNAIVCWRLAGVS
ncbi:hypothetical protein [Psychrobacter sp. JCM 18903]|uniref:hypothetical protein n=1 Tax=Psychrobacter sp. JCM 18903 TaxID=1298610 RepID=UPI001A9EB501|nr:hypothetical protein [Psychrobacter sp. JCM 18903]